MHAASQGNPRRRARGFTLLELLVVMAVIAMLFGLGGGIFTTLNVGARGTIGLIKTLVRSTRAQALRSRLPARCDLDAQAGSATGVYFEDIGQWHFESPRPGGWPPDVESAPPEGADVFWGFDSGAGVRPSASDARALPAGGAPGGYLALGSQGRVVIPTGGHQAFFSDHGFGVALSVRLHGPISGRIASRSGSFDLSLRQDGSLSGLIRLAEGGYGSSGRTRSAGTLNLSSPPAQVVPGIWTRIELIFDGRTARILVDGREAARQSSSMVVLLAMRESADVILGAGLDEPFDLDDVTLRSVRASGPIELPEGLRLSTLESDGRATSHLSIYFTPDGFLDPREHQSKVRVELEEQRGGGKVRRQSFRVGLAGILQEESS